MYSHLECHRHYHINYAVHAQSNMEEYYSTVPNIIQASKHYFLDCALIELIRISMVFGW